MKTQMKKRTQKNRKHRQTKRQRGGDTTKTINGTPIDLDKVVITDFQGNSRNYDDHMKHAEDMDRQGTR
jgi:hypothetical protein